MLRKILIIIYFLILLALAIASLLITWVNDTAIIIIIEIIVEFVIMVGIVLSLYNKRITWWLIPFLFSVSGEIYLLCIDERVGIIEAIEWALILSPAAYLNLQVAGVIGSILSILKIRINKNKSV